MKLSRLSAILDAYGADPARWPCGEREAALALTRASLPAARALADARALDAALVRQSFPDIADEADRFTQLHAAIVSTIHPRAPTWFGRWFGFDLAPSHLWPSVAGLAFASVLGFAVGLGGLLQTESDHESDEIAAVSPIDFSAIVQ